MRGGRPALPSTSRREPFQIFVTTFLAAAIEVSQGVSSMSMTTPPIDPGQASANGEPDPDDAARKRARLAFLAKTQAAGPTAHCLPPGCSEQAGEENEAIAVSKETAVKRRWGWWPSGSLWAKWPGRVLDGLAGLAKWLSGPDPGLNRLRTVLCATLTVAAAIGAEWLFAHFTGALQRPVPPAAAGTVLAAQVSVANRAVLVLAMVLGGITGLTAVISVLDSAPRDQVAGMLLLLPPMVGALAVSLAVGGHRVLALCLLPVVLAAGTYLRRFGPAGVRLAPVLFAGYLFGFLLRPLLDVGDTGWLTAEIGVGLAVAITVKIGVFHETSGCALRRTQRSYAARAGRLSALALTAFDDPGPRTSRRLHVQVSRLDETALVIDDQLADPSVSSAAAQLHQQLFDARVALANVVRFTEALTRSHLSEGEHARVRELLSDLAAGRRGRARAVAEALALHAAPSSGNVQQTVVHRLAESVTDFTGAMSQWLELGVQDYSRRDPPLFTSQVPLRAGGPQRAVAATDQASSNAEPGRLLPRAGVAPYVRTAIQVGVAIGAAIALGDVLSGPRFYWAVIGAFVVFQGTSNTEEQIGKAASRVAGTLVGIVAGSVLVNLIGMHAAWTIVVILVSVSLGLYLQRADYAFLVVGVTVLVSQLYVEFGQFSNALLVTRLEETAIGAAVAAATVLLVLPLHATRVARAALQGYLEVLAMLLQHAALSQAADLAQARGDTRALDAAYQALVSITQPLRPIQVGGERLAAAIAAAAASRHYALNLVRDIPRIARPDAGTRALLEWGWETLQASLTSVQSAVRGSSPGRYTRSASLFDQAERRLTGPGGSDGEGRLAVRDLRFLDGALAELARVLGMDITSYDTGPAADPARAPAPPDGAAGPGPGPPPRSEPGKTIGGHAPDSSSDY
jgi:hypothetical protein